MVHLVDPPGGPGELQADWALQEVPGGLGEGHPPPLLPAGVPGVVVRARALRLHVPGEGGSN